MSTATPLHDPIRERYGSLLPQRLPEHIARLRWSREQVAAHQRDELRRLLAYAIERSPYHARRLAGIDPDAFELADLASLPAMTKPDMMASFEDVVADHRVTRAMVDGYLHSATERNALLLDDYICLASGGSSGVRGVFVLRAETVPEMIGDVLRSSLARALQGGGPPPGGSSLAWRRRRRRCTRRVPAAVSWRGRSGASYTHRRRFRWTKSSPG
jgi:hypothetical protein